MSRKWVRAAFGTAAVAAGVYLTAAHGTAWGDLVAAWGIAVWVSTLWAGIEGLCLEPETAEPSFEGPSALRLHPVPRSACRLLEPPPEREDEGTSAVVLEG